MSEQTPAPSAQIDNFERNRVRITVTRTADATTEHLVQRLGEDGFLQEQWLPAADSLPTGCTPDVLDVRNDVAEAIYAALKTRFAAPPAEASTSGPSPERDGAHAVYLALKERFGPEDAAPVRAVEESAYASYCSLKARFEPEGALS